VGEGQEAAQELHLPLSAFMSARSASGATRIQRSSTSIQRFFASCRVWITMELVVV
jgi:hypothetical protein